MSGETWAPTKATMRALVTAMKLDAGETSRLHAAAEQAEHARARYRKRGPTARSRGPRPASGSASVTEQSDGAIVGPGTEELAATTDDVIGGDVIGDVAAPPPDVTAVRTDVTAPAEDTTVRADVIAPAEDTTVRADVTTERAEAPVPPGPVPITVRIRNSADSPAVNRPRMVPTRIPQVMPPTAHDLGGPDARGPSEVTAADAVAAASPPGGVGFTRVHHAPARRVSAKDVIICGLAVALAVMLGQVVRLSQGSSAPQGVGWARFASPSAGDRIAGRIDVHGIAELHQSQELWVLTRAPDNKIYTVTDQPAPVMIDARGDWAVHGVGLANRSATGQSKIGGKYELFLVASPSGSGISQVVHDRQPGQQTVGFTQLPGKSVVLDSVSVELSR